MRYLLQDLRYEFEDHPFLATLEAVGFAASLLTVAAGAYAQSFLPRGRGSGACYFTDALIILIECSSGPWEGLLNYAWFATWGYFVTVTFPPLWLPVAAPALLALTFALGFVFRLIRLLLRHAR